MTNIYKEMLDSWMQPDQVKAMVDLQIKNVMKEVTQLLGRQNPAVLRALQDHIWGYNVLIQEILNDNV